MFWRRKNLVEFDTCMMSVSDPLDAARGLFEAGLEAGKLKSGLLHQTAMSGETAADYRERMEAASVESLRNVAGDPGYLTRNTERED